MNISALGYLIKEGFKNVWSNRMMSIASVGVLISCLLLTGAASLFSMNVNDAVESVGGTNVFTVFLKDNVSELEAVFIGKEIKKINNIKDCEFYSKDEAMKQYQKGIGDELFNDMQGKDNPLPHAFHVSLTDLSKYSETAALVQKVTGVAQIRSKSEVAEQLTSLNRLVTTAGYWIVVLLGLISLFIISNTIRLSMYSRRFEISIMKSVGATNIFVRIPFIVEGIIIGLISSIISTFFLMFVYNLIMQAINRLIPFNGIPFGEVALPVAVIFAISGMLVGALGGFISIRKYLKKEGNEILGW